MKRYWIGLLLVALAFFMGGCSSFVDNDQGRVDADPTTILTPSHTVGQTFVAQHGGLEGIQVWLTPVEGSRGNVLLHLRLKPDAETDLATASLSLRNVTRAGFYSFSFPSFRHSHSRYYYAFLEMTGEGRVRVGQGPGDAYINGALYQDHAPLDGQMAFRLMYDPAVMALELIMAVARGVGLLTVAGMVYVLPGWALLDLVWHQRLSWAEKLSLGAGVSLSLYPLLFLMTDLIGLHLGSLYAWLPLLSGLGILLWRYRPWKPRIARESLKQWVRSDAFWPDTTLLIVTTMVFAVRLLVVRTLDAPMWGDSYQHTMITQLLIDNQGLFNSWKPYVPYKSLTVHYGFPTTAAILSWMTGIGSVRATLWAGQLVNGIAALTIYPLALRLTDGNRWAGVIAVLTAGLLSPMPAYYVNWGRYAQLTGQAILPVALWLLCGTIDERRIAWKAPLLAGAVLAGMTLTYYRMPFYYALFVASWLISWGIPRWKLNMRTWLTGVRSLVLIAGIALLLFLPWGLRILGGELAETIGTGATQASSLAHVRKAYGIWRRIDVFVPYPLLAISIVALGWSMVRQRWQVASLGLWVLGLASMVAGTLVPIPGANMMQNFAVLIALYIPVALLVGWVFGEITRLVPGAIPGRGWAIGTLALATAIWSGAGRTRIVDPSFIMVTRPDIRAMSWIKKNTPPDTKFLVEGFRIYDGRSAVGSDAGWWLPLLGARENTMPPQYALLNEAPVDPDYDQRVVDLVAHLETKPLDTAENLKALCSRGVTLVYVGQGQGKVGAGAMQLFSPDVLEMSSAYQEVYHRDRVRIFALDSSMCGAVGE